MLNVKIALENNDWSEKKNVIMTRRPNETEN